LFQRFSKTHFSFEVQWLRLALSKVPHTVDVSPSPFGGWDSIVGRATGYRLDDRGIAVRVPVGSRTISTSSRPDLGPTQPPIQWVPGVKLLGREANHSPPASVEVTQMWLYTSTPPFAFMTWCFIKHRDNFTFDNLRFFLELCQSSSCHLFFSMSPVFFYKFHKKINKLFYVFKLIFTHFSGTMRCVISTIADVNFMKINVLQHRHICHYIKYISYTGLFLGIVMVPSYRFPRV
jgi:hypothetical protein